MLHSMSDAQIPAVLHKLMPASFPDGEILPFLSNGMIRFAPPGSQNDPFECRGFVDDTDYKVLIDRSISQKQKELESQRLEQRIFGAKKEVLRQLEKELKREFLEDDCPGRKEMWQKIIKGRDEKIGMLCLTANIKSSAMWSHYADRHRGVAIGLDAKELAKLGRQSAPFTKLERVRYGRDVASFDMTREKPMGGFNPFIHKSEDWEYEKEWRILVSFAELRSKKKVLKNKDALGHVITLVKLGTHFIREIRLGCEASIEVENRVKLFARKSKTPIKVFRMRPAPRSYGIEEELLP